MTESTRLFLPEIREMLAEGQAGEIVQVLGDVHPSDWAELLEELEGPERSALFGALASSPELQVGVFRQLGAELQAELTRDLGAEAVAPLIPHLPSDERTDLVGELEEEEAREVLADLSASDRAEITRLLRFEEGSVGSCMQTEFVALDPRDTVADALEQVREATKDTPIHVLYVLDERGRLLGQVSLTELVRSAQRTPVEELFEPQVQSLHADDRSEDAAHAFQKYDVVALPVVNLDDQMIGIVTYDDVLDVMEEEATEDAQMMGAVAPLENSYLQTSTWAFAHKRGGWLTLLFVGQFLTLAVMSLFPEQEAAKDTVRALLMFIPLVVSAGGNCGSQSATLICRALATDEVSLSDWWRVASRELVMGLLLGSFVALLGFLYARFFFHVEQFRTVEYALVVAVSLVGIMSLSTLLGGLLPFLLKRIGLDPAIASTPLVASLSDVAGVLIFFTVSWFALLRPLLQP